MDNSHNQIDNQPSQVPEQVTAPMESSVPQAPPEKPHSRIEMKELLIVALVLLLLVLIPIAYVLGKNQADNEQAKNSSMSETSSTSDTNPAEEVEEAAIDDIDEYANWHTYEHIAYGYSFKYPADWQVEREVIQDPADWVSINPPGQTADSDALAIFTYADGVGCPETTKKEFTVGGYAVEGTACAGTEVYKVGMKHSKVAANGGSGVILARAAPDMVGIQIDMSRGEDETIQLILDSVTGLVPYGS